VFFPLTKNQVTEKKVEVHTVVWDRDEPEGGAPECTILQSNSNSDFLVESTHQ
jgi:hypothetical protein